MRNLLREKPWILVVFAAVDLALGLALVLLAASLIEKVLYGVIFALGLAYAIVEYSALRKRE